MTLLVLSISGMSCGHCLNAVRSALSTAPGVVVDSVRIGRAEVHFDPSITTPAKVATAVTDAGYEATHVG